MNRPGIIKIGSQYRIDSGKFAFGLLQDAKNQQFVVDSCFPYQNQHLLSEAPRKLSKSHDTPVANCRLNSGLSSFIAKPHSAQHFLWIGENRKKRRQKSAPPSLRV